LIGSAVRVPDPFVRIVPGGTLRRLAPDCARIELGDLPEDRDEERLLHVMGYELGNVHLGSSGAQKELLSDASRRPKRWLQESSREMTKLVMQDFEEWSKSPSPEGEKAKPHNSKKK